MQFLIKLPDVPLDRPNGDEKMIRNFFVAASIHNHLENFLLAARQLLDNALWRSLAQVGFTAKIGGYFQHITITLGRILGRRLLDYRVDALDRLGRQSRKARKWLIDLFIHALDR